MTATRRGTRTTQRRKIITKRSIHYYHHKLHEKSTNWQILVFEFWNLKNQSNKYNFHSIPFLYSFTIFNIYLFFLHIIAFQTNSSTQTFWGSFSSIEAFVCFVCSFAIERSLYHLTISREKKNDISFKLIFSKFL